MPSLSSCLPTQLQRRSFHQLAAAAIINLAPSYERTDASGLLGYSPIEMIKPARFRLQTELGRTMTRKQWRLSQSRACTSTRRFVHSNFHGLTGNRS